MKQMMPQEVEVFYLIPALRKELAQLFVSAHDLSQREAAALLGLTESAISQYLKDKRASGITFTAEEKKIVAKGAKKILEDKGNASQHIFDLTVKLRGSKSMCDLHKSLDSAVDKNCDICCH
mgnify:CR=1 FL=1|jgi:predicted transcriptional regulator|tara:strand:- start:344 stop:709 length:366 start_codon:yes stop_codon:yes gene_type:complete